MRYEQILYAVEDSMLTITLARPERLNAFTARMCRELLDAFDRSDADEGVTAFLEKRPAKFKMKPSEMPEFYPWWEPREFK